MKTFTLKKADLTRDWIIVDCTGQVLGRLASKIALILRGKHKSIYTPHMQCGDNVILINASKIHLTGNKMKQKIFYHHSGYFGGLKEIAYEKLNPAFIVEKAIERMLRQSALRRRIMAEQLKIFNGAEHIHEAQKPVKYKFNRQYVLEKINGGL